ncbi:uncharacterized protein PV07_09222 [Cladophialophora immunda]|uniref:Zn(2)-C6 fungal-type domain-containing protein n=1 Tax=Cladophialophora immunda TaxID=569365 RepID=A0A0D2C6I7_9EURO|nr:uncharacterized protein PV07_09222 [Cladophialophora immunda]KIW26095.1 hypothetical protein PV07_09222 [Cladophialophora immunda]
MESPSSSAAPSVQRRGKHTPRLRKACELCREVKGRCVPSQGDPARCLRCAREGKICVFLEAKARPKMANDSRSRVAEMEQRIEGILARLSSSEDAAGQPLHSRLITQTSANIHELPYSPLTQTAYTMPVNLPPFQFSNIVFDGFQDAVSKGFVSFEQAEASLQMFQGEARNFPFVVIDPTVGLDLFRRKRPFLLLSILTFAAQWNLALQAKLEAELKESLSRRLIVEGEKSLDLLQGLLVYLNWYHFQFDPARQVLYQLVQMANSLALDLGLDNPVRQELLVNPASLVPELRTKYLLALEEVEGRRALLGCYYLSSSICLAMRKPSSLAHSPHINSCGELLAGIGAAASDALLPIYVHLQRLQEDINQAFKYDRSDQEGERDPEKIETLCNRFEQQLEQSRSALPPEVWNNAKLASSYRAIRIYAREIGFHAHPPPPFSVPTARSSPSWYLSTTRHNSLLSCLEATREYLDHFLSLSAADILAFTTPDLLRLLYAMLVLGRFSTSVDAPLLDANLLHTMANLRYYLESLTAKFRDVLATIHNPSDHYLVYLCRMFADSKKWFAPALTSSPAVHEDLFSPKLTRMNAKPLITGNDCCLDIPGNQHSCPDITSAWSKPVASSDPCEAFMRWGDTGSG